VEDIVGGGAYKMERRLYERGGMSERGFCVKFTV